MPVNFPDPVTTGLPIQTRQDPPRQTSFLKDHSKRTHPGWSPQVFQKLSPEVARKQGVFPGDSEKTEVFGILKKVFISRTNRSQQELR